MVGIRFLPSAGERPESEEEYKAAWCLSQRDALRQMVTDLFGPQKRMS